jgi:hypothetical protein
MKYENNSVFEFSLAISNAESLLPKFPVHENHVSIATILKLDDVKSLDHVATRISQIDLLSDERNEIKIQSVIEVFSDLGLGCIKRFYPEDFNVPPSI